MKMPEKHDSLAAILAAKEQGIGATAFAMAYLRADIMAVRLQNSNRTQRCAPLSPSSPGDLLDFAGLSSNLVI